MPEDITTVIRDNATFWRQLKTRCATISRKYPTRSDKIRFLTIAENGVVARGNAMQKYLSDTYDYDWQNKCFFDGGRMPARTDQQLDLLIGRVFLTATRLHLNAYKQAFEQAKANHHDTLPPCFAIWLAGRVYAPLYALGVMMDDNTIPGDVRFRAIAIFSGWIEADSSLLHNKRMSKYVGGSLRNLRDELPNTVLTIWSQWPTDDLQREKHKTPVNAMRKALEHPEQETQYPTNEETSEACDFPAPLTSDPLHLFIASANAAARLGTMVQFLQSRTGRQREMIEIMAANPDIEDSEMAEIMKVNVSDVYTYRHRMKLAWEKLTEEQKKSEK